MMSYLLGDIIVSVYFVRVFQLLISLLAQNIQATVAVNVTWVEVVSRGRI